jgi:O-antigen/teichoic acid export membrane protein
VFLPVAKACASFDRAALRLYLGAATVVGLALGGAGLIIAIAFGRPILALVFRPEYAMRQDVLVRLMIAGTVSFAACGAGYVVTAARALNPQVPVLAAAAAAAFAVSAWQIPRSNLNGAADAVLASALVQFVGTAVIAWYIDRRLRRVAFARAGAAELAGTEPSPVEVETA